MKLQEYYNQILEKYKKKDFKVLRFNDLPLPKVREPHLEAQHFMMFEWCEDHKDDRYKDIFDYIVRPNDLDMDFTEVEFEDFLKFLASIKINGKK
jgi:hypothetical protein